MKIEMRAPRKSDIRDKVKKLTFTAEEIGENYEEELQFLKHLNRVYLDGGLILIYHADELIEKKVKVGDSEPSFAWNVGMVAKGEE